MFKNNVLRYETPECKIINKPVSLNEGNYRVDYIQIDKKELAPQLDHKPTVTQNKKFFEISPCVINKAECSLKSRKEAKVKQQQVFNSSI